MNYFAVHLKLTRYCKLAILQFLKIPPKKEFITDVSRGPFYS